MKKNSILVACFLGIITTVGLISASEEERLRPPQKNRPKLVSDILWVWGNPGMTEPGSHTLATFAEASPAQRADMLGVPNVIMAGAGLPHEHDRAMRLTDEIKDSPEIVWEILPDGQKDQQPPFVFNRRVSDLVPIVEKHPQVIAILLDDMTSLAASRGFRPEHIRDLRSLISAEELLLKIWGVLYTMNFSEDVTDDLVQELDVINLWTWHGKDLVDLEKNVAECERRYPDKPIMLGIYLYDYGEGRLMPRDLHKQQCEIALKLAHAGRIEGIVFLTINNDPETLEWTAEWIQRVGNQKLGSSVVQ